MNPEKVSVYAVGDVIPDWPNPESLFELALPTLKEADVLFGQLESTLAKNAERQMLAYFARRIGPEKVSALTSAGFNVMSFASNHALDLGEQAFLETIENLTGNNIAVLGVGKNIDEARKPLIVERNGTKVAFLAYCSVLPKGYAAGPDKPGCAPMRVSTFYEQIDWQPGTPPRIITIPDQNDLAAMVDDITKVRSVADVVILSIHWGVHFVPAAIAMYQKEVGHAAIDAGVDLILGHHPHLLKGIEVYKSKVIFYSLGNFVMPSGRGRKSEGRMHYNVREDPESPHYPYPVDSRKTMIVKCVISDKKIERVSFLPALINKKVQPEVMRRNDKGFGEVLNYVDEVSKDQGIDTKFSVEGDEIVMVTALSGG